VNAPDIQDSRFQADVDPENSVLRSIDGNRLIRTPEWQFNGSISKAINVPTGTWDILMAMKENGALKAMFLT